jgi:DNA-directed RNA polymerase specialized sigma24 family protein
MTTTTPTTTTNEKKFYVSNKELYGHYVTWNKAILEANEKGEELPEMPRFIAESIMKICNKLSYRPNFIGYSYREEMVEDAIENLVKVAKNFNPAKTNNPFSFITTIAWNAFLRRIEKEQTESYVKFKLMEDVPVDEMMNENHDDLELAQMHNNYVTYLQENSFLHAESPSERKKRKRREKEIDEINLTDFMDESGVKENNE